jgi:hypothetical protein
MKFKLGLLLGAAGGYLFGSGKGRELWRQVKPSKTPQSSMTLTDTDREVDTVVVDMTSSPLQSSMR